MYIYTLDKCKDDNIDKCIDNNIDKCIYRYIIEFCLSTLKNFTDTCLKTRNNLYEHNYLEFIKLVKAVVKKQRKCILRTHKINVTKFFSKGSFLPPNRDV